MWPFAIVKLETDDLHNNKFLILLPEVNTVMCNLLRILRSRTVQSVKWPGQRRDSPWIVVRNSTERQEILLVSNAPRPAVGPTQWVPGGSPHGGEVIGAWKLGTEGETNCCVSDCDTVKSGKWLASPRNTPYCLNLQGVSLWIESIRPKSCQANEQERVMT